MQYCLGFNTHSCSLSPPNDPSHPWLVSWNPFLQQNPPLPHQSHFPCLFSHLTQQFLPEFSNCTSTRSVKDNILKRTHYTVSNNQFWIPCFMNFDFSYCYHHWNQDSAVSEFIVDNLISTVLYSYHWVLLHYNHRLSDRNVHREMLWKRFKDEKESRLLNTRKLTQVEICGQKYKSQLVSLRSNGKEQWFIEIDPHANKLTRDPLRKIVAVNKI